jgi:hypothetical protein
MFSKAARKNGLQIWKNMKTRPGCLAILRMYPAFSVHTLDMTQLNLILLKCRRHDRKTCKFSEILLLIILSSAITLLARLKLVQHSFLKVRFKKRYTVHTCIHTVLCSCRGLKYDDQEFHCFRSFFCCKIHCEMLLMLKGLYKQDI